MHLGGMNSSLISEETRKKGRKKEELKKGETIRKNNSVAAGNEYFKMTMYPSIIKYLDSFL